MYKRQAPKTWDELKAAAATIKEKAGVDGVYLNPGGYFMPVSYTHLTLPTSDLV